MHHSTIRSFILISLIHISVNRNMALTFIPAADIVGFVFRDIITMVLHRKTPFMPPCIKCIEEANCLE